MKRNAWFSSNAQEIFWITPHAVKGGTQPVGTKLPNAFKLFDMNGNVAEWCWDWGSFLSSSAQTDPKGPESATYRIYRGGSWKSLRSDELCSGYRILLFTPLRRSNDIGFRVCRLRP